MNNAVFSETVLDVKKEFESEIYLDDKVLISETTINVDSTKLNKCSRDDQTKLDMSTDIKSELSPSNVVDHIIMKTDIKQELPSSDPNLYNTIVDDNIKIESNVVGDTKVKHKNKQLFCSNCNEYYEDYCTKCGMLICILNGSDLNNRVKNEIPASVLEIKEGLCGTIGVFAIKTIPKGAKFGPLTGFSTTKSSWGIKEGKFIVGNDKSELLNWMQYVNCAGNISDQNLDAFQYKDNLYYYSICEIQAGEELLVYFGEKCEESLDNAMDFMPHLKMDSENIFACTYCCLGFSLKVHLVEHKTICPNGTNGNFEELVQCPFCKIFLEKEEYLECHEIFCWKRNAKHCVLPALDDHALEEETLSPVANKRKKLHYKVNNKTNLKAFVEAKHVKEYDYNCMECEFKTNNKSYLQVHLKTKHLKEYNYNCMECEYKTNIKSHLQIHIKTKHLKEFDYNCMECEYKTNNKKDLLKHMKTKHLKEYDYNCTECEFKTNHKSHLQVHSKTKHLKEYDYNCMECEYKTNINSHLQIHIKAKHVKEFDYNCMECEFKANDKNNLQLHMKSKHLKECCYNCMECEFKTNNKSRLLVHWKTKHRKEYDYNCLECEYKTNIKSHLQVHVKTTHRKEYDYSCMECEYKTNTKAHLQVHVKTTHLKEYDYNCMECEYKTNNKKDLLKHMKTKHLKEYDYNCVECEFKTNNKSHLLVHLKTKHRKEYDYNCLECEYKTNIKSNLQIHMKTTHLKEYDFSCIECKYKTNTRLRLKTHMKVKHLS